MAMLQDFVAWAVSNLDLAAIGTRIGLTLEQLQAAAGQLLPQIANPNFDVMGMLLKK